MNVFTDLRLLNLAGAENELPLLPIDRDSPSADSAQSYVAPTVAPTGVILGQNWTLSITSGGRWHFDHENEKTLGIAKETKGFRESG